MDRYYYSFSQYLREHFGERVHRISLDGGFGCPNIDGTLSNEGCSFCNNKAFSYFSRDKQIPLREQITQAMDYVRRRFKAEKFIAYFQGFSSTYADVNILKQRYNTIREFPGIVGLAISTRPDCIDEEKLDLIASFTSDYTVYIEYGLGSVHDKALKSVNRNHNFSDFKKAVAMTAERNNIKIAAHIILGLPGETKDDMLKTARVISGVPLWGIKFHCLHIVKDTPLETLFNNGGVKLLSEGDYVDVLINFMEIIPRNWVILRLVSSADKSILVAPAWMNDKAGVLNKIDEELRKRNIHRKIET